MAKQGFTLLELLGILVVIAILSAVVVPRFINLAGQARQATTISVAEGLTAASASNFQAYRAGSPTTVAVSNCMDVAQVLLKEGHGLPRDYQIISQSVALGSAVTCTLVNPDGVTTATFVGHGVQGGA